MPGYIRRRGESWRIVVDAPPDPVTKKRRQVTRTVRGTKKEAQAAMRQLILDLGSQSSGTDVTLGTLLDRWLEHSGPDLSPKTLEDYQGLIRRTVRPELGAVPLRRLGTEHLDALYGRLRAAGAAPATVRKIHYLLRRALRQGVRWGWIEANPAVEAEPPKQVKTEIKVPSPEQVRSLIATARDAGDEEMAMLVHLAAVTGARRGELVGLRWDDLVLPEDLDELERARLAAAGRRPPAVLTIRRSVVAAGGRLVVKTTKTDRVRPIAVDEATVRGLMAHRRRTKERLLACGAALNPAAYMFPAQLGGEAPTRPDSLTHRFVRLCALAGVAGVRFHDLRHWAGTNMLARGVDIRTTMGRLGHSNMATTQGYAHFVEEADQDAAELLGRLVSGE